MRALLILRYFLVASIIFVPLSFTLAQGKIGNHEGATTPEKSRTAPIQTSSPKAATAFAVQSQSTTLGPNLIANPSVETTGGNGLPSGWGKGGYGSSTRTLTYPVTGTGGTSTK